MKRLTAFTVMLLVAAAQPGGEAAATARAVDKANAFLASLSDAQRAQGTFGFDDQKQRVRWSNLPSPMFSRAGLRLGDLGPTQRSAAMDLLSAALSKQGFEKVLAIMEGDEALKSQEQGNGPGPGPGSPPDFAQGRGKGKGKGGPGGPGGSPAFGKDNFYISILGAPSRTAPWMLQFGGHHLALNLTFAGSHGVLTPSLTAAQPARYTLNGKTVRPLGAENDKGFALINALDAGQQKQAILPYQVRDLVLGPGEDGKMIQPEGIKGSALQPAQQALLLDLIAEWSGIVHEAAAAARMAEIKAQLADTWFAWSGPTENGRAAYYRVQGPTLVIEYAPQSMGGDPTQHIHTIYRDPTNDYGVKWTKK